MYPCLVVWVKQSKITKYLVCGANCTKSRLFEKTGIDIRAVASWRCMFWCNSPNTTDDCYFTL